MRTTRTAANTAAEQCERHIARCVRSQVAKKASSGMAHSLTLWCLLVTDLTHCTLDVSIAWLVQLIGKYSLRWIAEHLKAIATFVRDYYPEASGVASPRSFIRSVGLTSVSKIDLMGPMWPIISIFLKCPDNVGLSQILSYAEFWSRVPFSEDLTSSTKEAYLEFERSYRDDYPEQDLIELRQIIVSMIDGFPIRFLPGHSGGATSECKRNGGLLGKEKAMVHTNASRLFCCRYGLDVEAHGIVGNNYSRWVPVTKNVLKMRSIAAEPTMHQYLQQGLLHGTLFGLLSKIGIDLSDSGEKNRQLAVEGSRTRLFGTIDLSNASDSVSQRLVRALFDRTELGYALQFSRTAWMDVDGTMIRLKKFASMGSAVCFPVECIVFEAIIRLAEKRVGVHRRHAVYGDDLVVHEDIFDMTISLLKTFHFEINSLKTFPPYHPFKESCGVEAYDGLPYEVSRLSRSFPGHDWSKPGSLESYLACRNSLRQYPHIRRYMTSMVLRRLPAIPFIPVGSTSLGLYSDWEWSSPDFSSSAYTVDYQTPYTTLPLMQFKQLNSDVDDDWAFLAWCRSKVDQPVSRSKLAWMDAKPPMIRPVTPCRVRRHLPYQWFPTDMERS